MQVYRAGDGCHREWLARRAPYLSSPARFTQNFSLFHQVMLSLEARLFAHPGLLRVIANSQQVREDILRLYGWTRPASGSFTTAWTGSAFTPWTPSPPPLSAAAWAPRRTAP